VKINLENQSAIYHWRKTLAETGI